MEWIWKWVTLALAVFGGIRTVYAFIRRRRAVNRLIASGKLAVICTLAGAIGSAFIFYENTQLRRPDTFTVTFSTYLPSSAGGQLKVVDGLKFNNQDLPLDGFVYRNVTFTDVCLQYSGGAFGLENATFAGHSRTCMTDQRLINVMNLLNALKLLRPNVTAENKKTVIP